MNIKHSTPELLNNEYRTQYTITKIGIKYTITNEYRTQYTITMLLYSM